MNAELHRLALAASYLLGAGQKDLADSVHEAVRELMERRARFAAFDELVETSKHYLVARGTTHGQMARNLLKAAIAKATGEQP